MADTIGKKNWGDTPEAGSTLDCEHWEALLADKMDGTLPPESEAAFAEHGRRCLGCGELLEQARQGQEWLKLLEENAPAAPVHLLSKILARTQGAGREADFSAGTAALAGIGGSTAQAGRWGISFLPAPGAGLVAARGAHNARMLMTAAMAFFSVALTLSVAGVRLHSVHAAELRPQAVEANVSRSFYGTKKQVVSFYENLRLVYEVESKMHDIRRDTVEAPARREAAPALQGNKPAAPGAQAAPKPHASGHAAAAEGPPLQDGSGGSKAPQQQEQVLHGWPVSAGYERAAQSLFVRVNGQSVPAGENVVLPGMLYGAMSKERNRI